MSSPRAAVGYQERPRLTSVEVCQVGNRRQRDQFLRFPWSIYRNDPVWVPPLLAERKEFLSTRKHPFFRHGAAVQFLAMADGQPVGRVLASDDPNYNAAHGTNTGCFGMFECIDDPGVAQALLDAAAGWLAARGRTQIMGPIDYSTNYACGLLIEGFETPPRVLMNHNPLYYVRLLENWGLRKAKDLYGWSFVISDYPTRKFGRVADRIARRGKVTIRPFNLKDKAAEIERCRAVYNAAWQSNWGFVRMSDPEFDHFANGLTQLVSPQLLLLAEADGKPVGLSLTLPDFNEAMRPLNGRLFKWGLPLGLLRFMLNCRKLHACRLVALGVVEEYRRRGLSELLIMRAAENARQQGITWAELGWTLEDNFAINHAIEAIGGVRYKTFRIYEKSLD